MYQKDWVEINNFRCISFILQNTIITTINKKILICFELESFFVSKSLSENFNKH